MSQIENKQITGEGQTKPLMSQVILTPQET